MAKGIARRHHRCVTYSYHFLGDLHTNFAYKVQLEGEMMPIWVVGSADGAPARRNQTLDGNGGASRAYASFSTPSPVMKQNRLFAGWASGRWTCRQCRRRTCPRVRSLESLRRMLATSSSVSGGHGERCLLRR